jgi:hypothetical protein
MNLKNNIILISLILTEFTSAASVDPTCQRWFLNNNISSFDESCYSKCASSMIDMGTFTCPMLCDKLCEPINCEKPAADQCLFYSQCIEEKKSCGPEGYAINYGQKYCLNFLENSELSEEGKKWRDITLMCLQKQLIPVYKEPQKYSCNQIQSIAFDSHVDCYTQVDSTICDLKFSDLYEISINIIEVKDLISWSGVKQEFKVGVTKCLPYYGEKLQNLIKQNSSNKLLSYFSVDDEISDLKKKITLVEEIRDNK